MSGVKKLTKVYAVRDYTTLACQPSLVVTDRGDAISEGSNGKVGQVIAGMKFVSFLSPDI